MDRLPAVVEGSNSRSRSDVAFTLAPKCLRVTTGSSTRRRLENRPSAASGFVVRLRRVDVSPSASRHDVALDDIEHAVRNAVASDDLDDDLRLYLGPSRSGALLEVISVVRDDDRTELVIHAMAMRAKYRRLLPGG